MRPRAPRPGRVLAVKQRPLPFSYFPVVKGKRRYGLFDVLFAASPWAVMRGAITDQLSGAARDEALAFLEQGRDFYEAATGRLTTNPLLVYYAFLNLGKALIRVRGFKGDLDRAAHGLFERHEDSRAQLDKAKVVVDEPGKRVPIFGQLVQSLGFARPRAGSEFPIVDLLPQVVLGHRLWREATHRGERFVGLEKVEFAQDQDSQLLWLRLYVQRGDLTRYSITHHKLVTESGLKDVFHPVKSPSKDDDELLCLEQTRPISYPGRPTDVVLELVEPMRSSLWRILTTDPDSAYRKYYVHLSPNGADFRLPQIASLWALMFYFGSVVRYRPHVFEAMSTGRFGAFIAEFIAAQPQQLLYMLASEMCRREVAKPAVI